MFDDPKDAERPQDPEFDDESKLDDLDPEEQGEDVIGGGYRPVSSTSRA